MYEEVKFCCDTCVAKGARMEVCNLRVFVGRDQTLFLIADCGKCGDKLVVRSTIEALASKIPYTASSKRIRYNM